MKRTFVREMTCGIVLSLGFVAIMTQAQPARGPVELRVDNLTNQRCLQGAIARGKQAILLAREGLGCSGKRILAQPAKLVGDRSDAAERLARAARVACGVDRV